MTSQSRPSTSPTASEKHDKTADMAVAERTQCPCCQRRQSVGFKRLLWTSFECPHCHCPLTIKTPRSAVLAGFTASALASLLLACLFLPLGIYAVAAAWVKAFIVCGASAGVIVDRAFGVVVLGAQHSGDTLHMAGQQAPGAMPAIVAAPPPVAARAAVAPKVAGPLPSYATRVFEMPAADPGAVAHNRRRTDHMPVHARSFNITMDGPRRRSSDRV
jgi:hypothetical protein